MQKKSFLEGIWGFATERMHLESLDIDLTFIKS